MIVICVSCNEKIFEFSRFDKCATDVAEASDFVPLDKTDGPSDGEAMVCPKCGEPFFRPNYDGAVCLYFGDNVWWPNPPADLLG